MMHKEIIIDSPEEKQARGELEARTDAEAVRMRRFLSAPDLSRTPGHPLHELVVRALNAKSLDGLDIIKIPEIVPAYVTFDLFNMPPGHPARSKSDTYYVNNENILRTHDTVFWYYYLGLPEIKEKIARRESFGAVCFGKVFRKDEIDRTHMNVFHQFGGLYLAPMSGADTKEIGLVWQEKLKEVLSDSARNIFGAEVNVRFNKDEFPYPDPSMEMEIEKDGVWTEILGCGVPRESVLQNLGVTRYTGWAFGFGLERLAIVSMSLPDIRLLWSDDERVKRQFVLGREFREVSKYPAVTRDISFVVPNSFAPNDYFDLIRDIGGDLVEEVALQDKYENAEKFGAGKLSYTYRIIYRHPDRTLTNAEVDALHKKLEERTAAEFKAIIR